MGQPVTFLRTSSPRFGLVRFELNRTITGMGHERYRAGEEIIGDRSVDELARRLLATGRLAAVHIHGSVVTAELADPADADEPGLSDAITGLYTYYVEGVEIPSDDELTAAASA